MGWVASIQALFSNSLLSEGVLRGRKRAATPNRTEGDMALRCIRWKHLSAENAFLQVQPSHIKQANHTESITSVIFLSLLRNQMFISQVMEHVVPFRNPVPYSRLHQLRAQTCAVLGEPA